MQDSIIYEFVAFGPLFNNLYDSTITAEAAGKVTKVTVIKDRGFHVGYPVVNKIDGQGNGVPYYFHMLIEPAFNIGITPDSAFEDESTLHG